MIGLGRLCSAAAAAIFVASCAKSDPIEGSGGSGQGGDPVGVGGGPIAVGSGGSGGGCIGDCADCGDGICSLVESCTTCPDDCGGCGDRCGDKICSPDETCDTCEADCGVCAACGDGSCDAGEDCDSCFMDCGICACAADANEPNGSSGTATPVPPATMVCDLSICATDVDWLAFTVQDGFTATLTFFQAEGDIDLEIYSGITLQYVTGSYSMDDEESVTLAGLDPGTYWARIYGADGAENPDYCFEVDTN